MSDLNQSHPRSRLYSLEPVGIGMCYVESLSSYIHRLALNHYLTSKHLIMGEIAPLLVDESALTLLQKKVNHLFRYSDAKAGINGMKELTGNVVAVLEQLTQRNDLQFLTLIRWQGILSQEELFRQYRAWCPHCYHQWLKDNSIIYEPLLWSLQDVEVCPFHQTSLVDQCPHCHSHLPAIANFAPPGICSQCGQWMGNEPEQTNQEPQPKPNNYLEEFIAITPQIPEQFTLEDLVRRLQVIRWGLERAIEEDLTKLMTFQNLVERLKIAVEQYQTKPFHLVNLIIPLCEATNLSLSQLFLNEPEELGQILSDQFNLGYQL